MLLITVACVNGHTWDTDADQQTHDKEVRCPQCGEKINRIVSAPDVRVFYEGRDGSRRQMR